MTTAEVPCGLIPDGMTTERPTDNEHTCVSGWLHCWSNKHEEWIDTGIIIFVHDNETIAQAYKRRLGLEYASVQAWHIVLFQTT